MEGLQELGYTKATNAGWPNNGASLTDMIKTREDLDKLMKEFESKMKKGWNAIKASGTLDRLKVGELVG